MVRTQYLASWLGGFDDRCNSRTSLDKDRNRRLRLHVVGFVTLLSSDKNNQLLSGSQPAPRGGESLASHTAGIINILIAQTVHNGFTSF